MAKSSRSTAAAVGEGKAKKAARKWIGWEEEIRWVVEEDGEEPRKVCYYYIRRAPAQGGGKRDNYLVVVGKDWGAGNMAYTAHPKFLVSLDKAMKTAPQSSRVATVAAEVTELRWMSRKEIMVWLSSLISDPPYGIRGLAIPDDYDGSSPASKDTLSTLAAAAAAVENKEGFRWSCKLPHFDERRRHYKSFYHEGMRIAVHDFVYIKSEGGARHVAYVEDMYEYDSARKMVLARWFKKADDDHGAMLPADVHNREVFFSYALQDLRVESVVGLAAVMNSQHFETFQQSEEGSSWQPYLCHRQIEDKIVGPFDMTQLEGYEKQEIVRAIVKASSSTTVQAKEAPSSTTVHAITVGAVENHGSSNTIIGDETNHGSSNLVTGDETNHGSSSLVIGDETNHGSSGTVIGDQTNHGSSSNVIGDQTNHGSSSTVIGEKTNHGSSSTVIGDQTNHGSSSNVIGEKTNHGSSSTVIGDQTNHGSSSTVIGDKTNHGSSSTVIGEKTNHGSSSIVIGDQTNHGSSSTVIGDKTNHGSSSTIIGDKTNHGSSSNVIGDKTNHGSSGIVMDDKTNHGSSDVVMDDKINHGSSGIVMDDKTNHGSSGTVIGDKTNHDFSGTVMDDKTNHGSSGTVIGGKTMQKQKQKQKLKQKPPPCSTTTVAQHTSITNDQTVESNMVSSQTAQNEQPPSSNAAANLEATTVKKRHPSGGFGSGSGLRSIVLPIKSDGEPMFQPGCHIEVLCQDSSVRGCWFRCVVHKTREPDEVQVQYLDVQNADDTGNLKEWLKLTRTAARDTLGIRLNKRMMIRPQFPPKSAFYRKLESPVAFGAVVDAKKDNRWCEGIVLGQDTEGRVNVHLQGENQQQVFEVGDLRQSIEWHEGKWKSLQQRIDVASGLVPTSQKKPAEQIAGQKPAEKLRPTAPKRILDMVQGVELEQSAKPVAPLKKRALMDSLQSASKKAAEFAALTPRMKPRAWFAKTGPPRKRFQGCFSLEEATLKLKDRENKGPAEHANPAEEKASLQQHHEEGDGSTDAKRRRLDLVNYVSIKPAELKAGTSSGGMGSSEGSNQGGIGESASNGGAMKPAELKAGTSSGGMGSSEGSSQGGIGESASNGGAAAAVNPVPAEGVCITNKEATVPAVSEQEVIDLTMDD